MRKKIVITVLALLLVATAAMAATTDFVANGNITVKNVSGVGNLIIKSGSKAASWAFSNGNVFTVTDPDVTAGFTILSSDTNVTAFQILNDTTSVGLSCDLNATPGTTEKALSTTAGTYRVVASTATNCSQLCTTVNGAATYNDYPTCGAATCNSGFRLSGSGSSAVCLVTGGGGVSGGGGGGGTSVAQTASPSPSVSPTPTAGSGASASGSLVRYANDPKVYVIENGQKHWIQTVNDFNKLGYKWSDVKVILSSEIYPTGEAKVPSTQAAVMLIRYPNDPRTYVVENNQKRWVKTAEDFKKLGYKWSDVKVIPLTETYATGADKTAIVSAVTTLTKILKKGSSGGEVNLLQEKLKALGYFPSDVGTTQYFGNTTQKAVKDFQKAKGLSPSGILDAKTRELLNQ